MYFQMLHLSREKDAIVEPAFPEGNIGFMTAIPPIGTKFTPAKVMGSKVKKTYLRLRRLVVPYGLTLDKRQTQPAYMTVYDGLYLLHRDSLTKL